MRFRQIQNMRDPLSHAKPSDPASTFVFRTFGSLKQLLLAIGTPSIRIRSRFGAAA